jgi:hypothetical protein
LLLAPAAAVESLKGRRTTIAENDGKLSGTRPPPSKTPPPPTTHSENEYIYMADGKKGWMAAHHSNFGKFNPTEWLWW